MRFSLKAWLVAISFFLIATSHFVTSLRLSFRSAECKALAAELERTKDTDCRSCLEVNSLPSYATVYSWQWQVFVPDGCDYELLASLSDDKAHELGKEYQPLFQSVGQGESVIAVSFTRPMTEEWDDRDVAVLRVSIVSDRGYFSKSVNVPWKELIWTLARSPLDNDGGIGPRSGTVKLDIEDTNVVTLLDSTALLGQKNNTTSERVPGPSVWLKRK